MDPVQQNMQKQTQEPIFKPTNPSSPATIARTNVLLIW